jgi:hypothetical protein
MQTVTLNDYDLIFLGSGINFANPYQELIRYVQTAELNEVKRFGVFLTWGGAGLAYKQALNKLQTLLELKGQIMLAEYFLCFGGRSFTLLRRGHPNSEDLAAAKDWAKRIVTNNQLK